MFVNYVNDRFVSVNQAVVIKQKRQRVRKELLAKYRELIRAKAHFHWTGEVSK